MSDDFLKQYRVHLIGVDVHSKFLRELQLGK